jgi:hypothetical protein
MANAYLVDIHLFLSNHINEREKAAKDALDQGDRAAHQIHRGALSEFTRIRKFLDENFNLQTQTYH